MKYGVNLHLVALNSKKTIPETLYIAIESPFTDYGNTKSFKSKFAADLQLTPPTLVIPDHVVELTLTLFEQRKLVKDKELCRFKLPLASPVASLAPTALTLNSAEFTLECSVLAQIIAQKSESMSSMDSCEEKVIKGTSFNSKPRQRNSTNFDSIIHIRLETISYNDEKTLKTATLKISNGENRTVKSKAVKFHGPVGEIRADVDIHHYKEDGDEILIILLDGKAVLARGTLSLAEIQPDKVNSKNIEMKTASILSGALSKVGELKLAISKTGAKKSEQEQLEIMKDSQKTGKLTIMLICATKLKTSRDVIASIRFGNERLETTPSKDSGGVALWGDRFVVDIFDPHDLVEISLFESRKKESLGQLFISLHKLKPKVSYHFYLKDAKGRLTESTLEFEIDFKFNPFISGLKMFTPKRSAIWEDTKEDVSLVRMARLVTRIKSFIVTPDLEAIAQNIDDILRWKRPLVSVSTLFGWLIFVNCFELWMIPFALATALISQKFAIKKKKDSDDSQSIDRKKSSAAKDFKLLQDSKDALRNAQDTLEGVAEILEKIQNTWNWEIGFSSATLSIAVFIITFVLYLVPIRIMLSLWGVNKICRLLIQPGFINNNEIADFLSRQPSTRQLELISNELVEVSAQ
ncbi:unnamed protein product [Oikopleura dioica]|uniref:C2 domain-containing protein n=1 Tax=Oikopleura dioica TaxID=34765 RepID=E4X7G6_OIKDI|nr:unnamed protein product [Oikopleura dioica]